MIDGRLYLDRQQEEKNDLWKSQVEHGRRKNEKVVHAVIVAGNYYIAM